MRPTHLLMALSTALTLAAAPVAATTIIPPLGACTDADGTAYRESSNVGAIAAGWAGPVMTLAYCGNDRVMDATSAHSRPSAAQIFEGAMRTAKAETMSQLAWRMRDAGHEVAFRTVPGGSCLCDPAVRADSHKTEWSHDHGGN